MRNFRKNILIGAVTGAALIAASSSVQAVPKEPNCQWNKNGYPEYKLAYPQGCQLKEYDSKEPDNKPGPYTS